MWELIEIRLLDFAWENKCKRCCMECPKQFRCKNVCVKECIICEECFYDKNGGWNEYKES